jgi:hypothetical protein
MGKILNWRKEVKFRELRGKEAKFKELCRKVVKFKEL